MVTPIFALSYWLEIVCRRMIKTHTKAQLNMLDRYHRTDKNAGKRQDDYTFHSWFKKERYVIPPYEFGQGTDTITRRKRVQKGDG